MAQSLCHRLPRKRTSTRGPRWCYLLLFSAAPRPYRGCCGRGHGETAVRTPACPLPRGWGVFASLRAHPKGKRAERGARGPCWATGGAANPPAPARPQLLSPAGPPRSPQRSPHAPPTVPSVPRPRTTAHSTPPLFGASTPSSRRYSSGDRKTGWDAKRQAATATARRLRSHRRLPAPSVPAVGYHRSRRPSAEVPRSTPRRGATSRVAPGLRFFSDRWGGPAPVDPTWGSRGVTVIARWAG